MGLIDDMIQKMTADLEGKKEVILKEKVEQAGYVWPIIVGRFKRLMRCVPKGDPNTEYWFYDDGSFEGLFLVGFSLQTNFSVFDIHNRTTQATAEVVILNTYPKELQITC